MKYFPKASNYSKYVFTTILTSNSIAIYLSKADTRYSYMKQNKISNTISHEIFEKMNKVISML